MNHTLTHAHCPAGLQSYVVKGEHVQQVTVESSGKGSKGRRIKVNKLIDRNIKWGLI